MRKFVALALALSLLLCLFACGKKDIGLPVYNNIPYEQEDDDTYIIPGIKGEDFDAYLELLRENGFTFTPSEALPTEEEAMAIDLWQGGKDDLNISVWLMLNPFTGEQHLEVNIIE